jgi:hypothetical protein
LVGLIGWVLAAQAQDREPQARPDPAALARLGQASVERFATESASWTTIDSLPNGAQFVVEVLKTPTMKRSIVSIEAQGRRERLVLLIEKGGLWYTVQGRKSGKYRRYEAAIDVPTAYVHLSRSNLFFITVPDLSGFGDFESTKDGMATYRGGLPEVSRKQLESAIAEVDRLKAENPGQPIKPETIRAMEKSKDLLAKGIGTDVDLKTGMIVQFGSPERRTRVVDFQWRAAVDPIEFATEGRTWDDFTDDPTTIDRNDLAMLGHCGAWKPGMKTPESDGRLVDVKTGRFRRIPFQGDLSLPGCFTRDRTRVIVTGADTLNGVMGLYEINLKTEENRRLGGELLATGFSLFPTLSPDGQTVAVLHKNGTERLLESQICLVNLATGEARTLGQPRDTGPISWTPDGKGLILVERKSVGISKPPRETICRLDLDGQLTRLIEGSSPVLVGDRSRILFQNLPMKMWNTCDLNGGDVRIYANGMKGHGFPAPSPDGKRLLMMRFQVGQAPEPIVFPLDQVEGTPATTAPGLWMSPAWR